MDVSPEALRQSQEFNRTHKIGETEPISFGFRDAGRSTPFDERGQPTKQPRREIIVAASSAQDSVLKQAIDTAVAATINRTELARIDYLNDYVGDLLKVNDPDQNRALLDRIAGEGGARGAEISLGQMIAAGTGVCRHRSLLFKVIADQLGIPAALVRGNYLRRGADGGKEKENTRGGHAWNEVVLRSGERILVDVMHNFVAELSDPLLVSYSDVRNVPLYPEAGQDKAAIKVSESQMREHSEELAIIRAAPWVSVRSPSGGRSAYVYLDAMNQSGEQALGRALQIEAIHHDRYRTSFGSNGGRREVLRVRGTAHLILRRTGAKLDRPVPAEPVDSE